MNYDDPTGDTLHYIFAVLGWAFVALVIGTLLWVIFLIVISHYEEYVLNREEARNARIKAELERSIKHALELRKKFDEDTIFQAAQEAQSDFC